MFKTTKQLLCALALTATFAAPALAGPTIKFGHVGQPGSLMDKTVTEYAKRANEALGDKAEVKVFGSAAIRKCSRSSSWAQSTCRCLRPS